MYNEPRYSGPTALGLDERIERVLCYVLGWVTGLIFLVVETRNPTVRRHAWQSIVVFGALSLLAAVVSLFGGVLSQIILIGIVFKVLFGLIGGVIGIVTFALWVLLMIGAYLSPDTFIRPSHRFV